MLKFLIFKDFSNKLYENKALYALAQMAHMYLILTFHFFFYKWKIKAVWSVSNVFGTR